jgi:hypothetical protein
MQHSVRPAELAGKLLAMGPEAIEQPLRAQEIKERRNRWVRQVRCRKGRGASLFLCATSLSTAVFLWRHIAPAQRQQRAAFVNEL